MKVVARFWTDLGGMDRHDEHEDEDDENDDEEDDGELSFHASVGLRRCASWTVNTVRRHPHMT